MGAVVAIHFAAGQRREHVTPPLKVASLLPLVLCKQVVGNANRQLPIASESINDLIVFGIVLKAAARIDHTRDAKPVAVELAAPLLTSGQLQRVLPSWVAGRLFLYAALPTRKHVPKKTRLFLDYLTDEIRIKVSRALLQCQVCTEG